MTSLYSIIYTFLDNIMSTNAELNSAAQLIAICATLAITYFIVLYPLKLILDYIFRRKAKK